MGDIYFGAVSAGTLVRAPPEWIVNTILLGGTAVPLAITEPAGLFVVRSSDRRYVALTESGEAALSAQSATPFRVFVHGEVYYIQVPAGPLDRPSRNEITVLSPKGAKLGIDAMVTKSPNARLGWKQKT